MRPALCIVSLTLALSTGCSLGPPPAITQPEALACEDLRRGLIGTWMRDGGAMELRADGSILRDGVEGAFRWIAPGRATIDMAGTHEQHTLGLTSTAQLLDVDQNGRGLVWARVSALPNIPEGCFDVRGSLVGEWTDGTTTESFHDDGTYARGDVEGNWSVAERGYVDIAIAMRVRRYRIALATPDTIVSIAEAPLVDDPRGGTLVELRMR